MTRPWERALDEHVHLIRWLETTLGAGYTKSVSPDEGITDLRAALNKAETFWVSFDMYKLTRHVGDRLAGKTLRDTPSVGGRDAQAGRTLEGAEPTRRTWRSPKDDLPASFPTSPLYRFLLAFWLLCDQRLVRAATSPVDRPARRRAERANLNLEDGVKVITLRREEARPKTAAADQPVDVQWSHRWIVSEHERNQWYPSLGMHLPITIEAYEKGPEGAPLVIKDRIYKVDR